MSPQDRILHMRISSELWDEIDAWIETKSPWPPKFSEAVRYLLERGLEAERKGKKR